MWHRLWQLLWSSHVHHWQGQVVVACLGLALPLTLVAAITAGRSGSTPGARVLRALALFAGLSAALGGAAMVIASRQRLVRAAGLGGPGTEDPLHFAVADAFYGGERGLLIVGLAAAIVGAGGCALIARRALARAPAGPAEPSLTLGASAASGVPGPSASPWRAWGGTMSAGSLLLGIALVRRTVLVLSVDYSAPQSAPFEGLLAAMNDGARTGPVIVALGCGLCAAILRWRAPRASAQHRAKLPWILGLFLFVAGAVAFAATRPLAEDTLHPLRPIEGWSLGAEEADTLPRVKACSSGDGTPEGPEVLLRGDRIFAGSRELSDAKEVMEAFSASLALREKHLHLPRWLQLYVDGSASPASAKRALTALSALGPDAILLRVAEDQPPWSSRTFGEIRRKPRFCSLRLAWANGDRRMSDFDSFDEVAGEALAHPEASWSP